MKSTYIKMILQLLSVYLSIVDCETSTTFLHNKIRQKNRNRNKGKQTVQQNQTNAIAKQPNSPGQADRTLIDSVFSDDKTFEQRFHKNKQEVDNAVRNLQKWENRNYKPGEKIALNTDENFNALNASQLALKKKEFQDKIKTMTDDQKILAYPNSFYWEYLQTNREAYAQDKLNQKAQDIYTKNPEGSDDHEDFLKESEMGLLIQYYGRHDNDENMKYYHMMLNDNNLYIGLKNETYRGIVASIELQYMYDEGGKGNAAQDDVRMGQCCHTIGTISTRLFGDLNNQQAYRCFQIDDYHGKQTWHACNTDQDLVEDWRQAIILSIIKIGLKRYGIFGLEELMKFMKLQCNGDHQMSGWSYRAQSRWPCMCPEGDFQSPIDIKVKDVINVTTARIIPRYRKTTNAVINAHYTESTLEGEFGELMLKSPDRKFSRWQAKSIRFKLASEHSIDGQYYPCEIQVIHTDGDSKLGFSLFLTDKYKKIQSTKLVAEKNRDLIDEGEMFESDDDVTEIFQGDTKGMKKYVKGIMAASNAFIKSFFKKKWFDRTKFTNPNQQESEYQCVEIETDLMDIFKDDTKLSKSFFMYEGSDSIPPCNEDMTWIIMKEPLFVKKSIISLLQISVLGKTQLVRNQRQQMPLNGRKVYGHDECPIYQFDPVIEPPGDDAQLLKAKVQRHWYAIVYPGTKTMFDDSNGKFQAKQNKYFIKNETGWGEFISKNKQKPTFLDDSDYYHVQSLSETDMQNQAKTTPGLGQIRQDLRFQLGEWLVNNRDKIMDNQLKKIDEKYGRDEINGVKEA